MAISLINVGQIANDGTGDDLREAMIKINQNFEELDLRDDEQTTASNLGAVGEGLFANKVGYDLQFKKLVGGTNLTLTSSENTLTIDAVGGLQQLIVSSESGSIVLAEGSTLNIVGGDGISTSLVNDTLTITNTESDIVTDTTPQLGGNLDAQNFSIANVNAVSATSVNAAVTGDVTGLVHGIDIRDLKVFQDKLDDGFDFGTFADSVDNILDWIIGSTSVDMGTFGTPELRLIDLGTF